MLSFFMDGTAPKADSPVSFDWSVIKNIPVEDLINQLISRLVHFSIQVAIAIAVFYIGKFIIRKIHNMLRGIFVRRRVDPSLSAFLLSMVRIALYFILVVTVIGILGIETSSFIALFASAGVAIGMALSGTLQNFAGGVLILLLKPYRVGNYIEAQGYSGTVKEIQIFHTIINTYDNKSIIIPNGGLSTGSINNWSREEYRRVDWPVSVSYGNDFATVRDALLEIIDSDPDIVKRYIEDDRHERALRAGKADVAEDSDTDGNADDITAETSASPWWKRILHPGSKKAVHSAETAKTQHDSQRIDRSPSVYLEQLADSSVNLKVRAWVPTALYWDVFYRINERIYTELPRPGISFPFPQLDVHLSHISNTPLSPKSQQ